MSLFAYGQYKNIILDWKTKKKKKKTTKNASEIAAQAA